MSALDYDPSLSEWIEVTREDGTTRRVEVVRRNARGQVVWMASSNTHRALWGNERGRAVPARGWSIDNPPEATRIGEMW